MENIIQNISATTRFLRDRGFGAAKAAVILGTGLGRLVKKTRIERSVSYSEIPHFADSTVEFHKGNLLLGNINGCKVIILQGRFHYYEGHHMQQVTFPVRVLKALGVEMLFLSNAAGGLNPAFKKGDLVLIEDHINFQTENPLRGLNDPAFGDRFVDLSRPYDISLSKQLKKTARSLEIKLKKGVYASVNGPNLETRAEYRFLFSAGADMVGMSTVPEVIVANQVGLPCAAVSIITDECNPDKLKPVSIHEIIKVAAKADRKLSKLFRSAIREWSSGNG